MQNNRASQTPSLDIHPVVFIAPATPCLIALFKLPYGYYTFLRLVATLSSSFIAYVGWEGDRKFFAFVFIVVALLFNPIIR